MSRDIEVLSHLVGSLDELIRKLEKSVNENKIDEANSIKATIFEINKKIIEESA
ncbi:Uncharacterised protein [uncultured archaeon]|nr:Uncharacterised protein [uncultured archaeon]